MNLRNLGKTLSYPHRKYHPICLMRSLSLVLGSMKIQLIHSFHHVTYSCVFHFRLDSKVMPGYLPCSCILNNNSIAGSDIIPFATTSNGSHNTPNQNSLQSIRTSIFICNEINWFQSLCTVCTN